MTTTLEALQTALAAEYAAVWSFAVLGARVSDAAQPALAAGLDDSYTRHRSRRDQLVAAVRDLGVQPVASAVAYGLPNPAVTVAQVQAAAGILEERCTAVYADLVAATTGDLRQWAVAALAQTAVHELGFRERPENFPGVTELANR